jgi:hypothetical protein
MAASSNIKILTEPIKLIHAIDYPKKTDEVLAQGDLVEENGSGAEAVDGTANDVFVGVVLKGAEADDVGPISVMIRGVISVQMAAGESASFGSALAYAAGANGTDWTFAAATVDGIVWALEAIATAGSGKALVDVLALETGIFETVTGTTTSTSSSTTSTTSTSTSTTSTTTS